MDKIIITIETTNAAFEDEGINEVVRILRNIADRCEFFNGIEKGNILDINGNTVGKVEVK